MAHVQIRNVPPALHRKLKARAKAAGLSLSDYLLAELTRDAQRPTMQEWLARVRSQKLYDLRTRPADIIREEREGRS